MKRTLLLLLALSLCLHAARAGAEPPTPPLIGPGRDALTARDLTSLRKMMRAFTGGTMEQIWMIDCQAWTDGPHAGRPFRAEIYLTPRVSTGRLIRCRHILCVFPPEENTWNRDSPVIGGWSCTDHEPRAYAFVAPAGETLPPGGPYGRAFAAPYTWSDEEVLSLVDAEHAAAPEQAILGLNRLSADHARIHGIGKGGRPNLEIDFERTAGVWTETRRFQWEY